MCDPRVYIDLSCTPRNKQARKSTQLCFTPLPLRYFHDRLWHRITARARRPCSSAIWNALSLWLGGWFLSSSLKLVGGGLVYLGALRLKHLNGGTARQDVTFYDSRMLAFGRSTSFLPPSCPSSSSLFSPHTTRWGAAGAALGGRGRVASASQVAAVAPASHGGGRGFAFTWWRRGASASHGPWLRPWSWRPLASQQPLAAGSPLRAAALITATAHHSSTSPLVQRV